jgi:hypothetical protein
MSEGLGSKRWADRTERRVMVMSPRHPGFVQSVLEPMAERYGAGESGRELSAELYEVLHPWAMALARAQLAGLPAHADRSEVISQVLGITWDACRRIDWTRCHEWPAFLESKVGRARVEAARSDDWLSRGERVRRRRFQCELARLEQSAGRRLDPTERREVASAVAPSSSRVDWAKLLLACRHPSSVGNVPDMSNDEDVEDQVEAREMAAIRARCIYEWLAIVGTQNQCLAADIQQWTASNETGINELPARLAHRIHPYTPLLLAMLGEAA